MTARPRICPLYFEGLRRDQMIYVNAFAGMPVRADPLHYTKAAASSSSRRPVGPAAGS